MKRNKTQLTYAESGVDITVGNTFVDKIKPIVKDTYRPEILGAIGGFNSICKIPTSYKNPVMVSATDGVGSKLKFAIDLNNHSSIGIDLVAMCVNDLVVCGAEPLFFLDYYATAKLQPEIAYSVVLGICQGCKIAGCSLIGGETAEMPKLYQQGDYDLAGFCVGIAEQNSMIDGSTIKADDIIIGLPSSGLHSNGYSLMHSIIAEQKPSLNLTIGGKSLSEWLIEPTKIYVKQLLECQKKITIKGLAHITGGGLLENIPRVLPLSCSAVLQAKNWQPQEIFRWIEQHNIDRQEMYRVFNMGIGMIVIVSPQDREQALQLLSSFDAREIGYIAKKQKESVIIQ